MRENDMKIIKFALLIVPVFVLLTLSTGCVTKLYDRQEPTWGLNPFFWRATSPLGQTMYLFGSMHVGTADMYPLPDFVMDAFYRSDFLAVETWGQEPTRELFRYTDDRTLYDDLGVEQTNKILDFLHQNEHFFPWPLEMVLGVPIDDLIHFKPQFIFALPSFLTIHMTEVSSEYGLDRYFIMQAFAREDEMDIIGIECAVENALSLLGMSLPLQIALIENEIDIEGALNELHMIYNAYVSGCEVAMAAVWDISMNALSYDLAEEWRHILSTRRDKQMTETAIQWMDEGKNVFFVAGAFHMVLEGGIIDQLIQAGYTVERLRY
jgi:hypothetical protein